MHDKQASDVIEVQEIDRKGRRQLDKGKILSFSEIQPGQVFVIYDSEEKPESFIIEGEAGIFQDCLNGVLPLCVLDQRTKEYNKKARAADVPLSKRVNAKLGLLQSFREEAEEFKLVNRDQDQYWFLPDERGEYKNVAADSIYNVRPNPNSPWARDI